jgi:hypothetical protein
MLDGDALRISVKSSEGYSAVEGVGLLAALRTELSAELLAEGRSESLSAIFGSTEEEKAGYHRPHPATRGCRARVRTAINALHDYIT